MDFRNTTDNTKSIINIDLELLKSLGHAKTLSFNEILFCTSLVWIFPIHTGRLISGSSPASGSQRIL